ncbi:hypothetical protein TNIN_225191 [Trichonephila inaurata madagascariensis]|uniref:Uncharacterized protein n=1 Tax=Trichonephila inaurata madagascariensis TaxID=2747483 RepID=A0A8X7C0L0_9ARAC|nr:hypothetical protein TNIN_225191 [Trichonephila inaurata madagascariensis]
MVLMVFLSPWVKASCGGRSVFVQCSSFGRTHSVFPPDMFVSDIPCLPGPRDSRVPLAETIFIDAFTQRVHASETLTRLLDFCKVSGLEYSEKLYRIALSYHIKWGMSHPDVAAHIAAEPIALFPNLPLDTMVRVYSSIVARYLCTEGVLNENNAVSLALSFAEKLEDCNRQTSRLRPDHRSQTINHGLAQFLSLFVHFDEIKGWKLATLYGNGWQTEARRLGLL